MGSSKGLEESDARSVETNSGAEISDGSQKKINGIGRNELE